MKIEPLSKKHNRSAFDCGNDELNRYFHEYVSQDVRRRQNICNVLVDDEVVVGFYTLAPHALQASEAPQLSVGHRTTIPSFLLGKLAVDKKYRGQGYGTTLLKDSVQFCMTCTIQAPCIEVDLKSADLMPFYQKNGFEPISELRAI